MRILLGSFIFEKLKKYKFASKGFIICTTYGTLYPKTLDLDKEKLHKEPFNGKKRDEPQVEQRTRDPLHATCVVHTE